MVLSDEMAEPNWSHVASGNELGQQRSDTWHVAGKAWNAWRVGPIAADGAISAKGTRDRAPAVADNSATPAKAADGWQQRWRHLSIGGATSVVVWWRCSSGGPALGGCVGWCGCGMVGAGTTQATPAAAAEKREEPAGRREMSGSEERE
ncbi:hypothetical protein Syun_017313 [Stephania yunnanensis]|uniref:Uncharacterized protein n=1 Tax=Stephania yunnanensis TaxID=152371 RepID=A0AAP0P5Q3_9MAGN